MGTPGKRARTDGMTRRSGPAVGSSRPNGPEPSGASAAPETQEPVGAWEADDSLRAAFGMEQCGTPSADAGDASEALDGGASSVQLREQRGRNIDPSTIPSAAAAGVAGTGGSLPHQETVQASFGSYDVSKVQAHVGGPASAASEEMGAVAYATGNHVAFGAEPDLYTTAHEAAHVIQQRGGIQLRDAVGRPGDQFEVHANRVADAVVSGRSAESILAEVTPPDRTNAPVATGQVQHFLEHEHAELGNMGSGDRQVELANGFFVPFGQVTMLAGDYFGSLEALQEIASKEGPGPGTREEIEYILYKSLDLHYEEEHVENLKKGDPQSESFVTQAAELRLKKMKANVRNWSKPVIEAVEARYMQLALGNTSHFVAPFGGDSGRPPQVDDTNSCELDPANETAEGCAANPNDDLSVWLNVTPDTAPRAYRYNHVRAIAEAITAGRKAGANINKAMLREAFASHYLTDSFAAGHARTKRADIKAHWNARVPMFEENFQGYLAEVISEELAPTMNVTEATAYDGVEIDSPTVGGWYMPIINKPGAYEQIGEALATKRGLGFGDFVAGIMHDYDNKTGLLATSGGRLVTLYGDGHMMEGDSQELAVSAVAIGIMDVEQAFEYSQGGMSVDEIMSSLTEREGMFAAEAMIPTALDDDNQFEDQQTPKWDYETVEELLAEPKFQEGAGIFFDEKVEELKEGVATQDAAVRAAFKKRIIDRVGSAQGATAVIRDIISWVPQLGSLMEYLNASSTMENGDLENQDASALTVYSVSHAREYVATAQMRGALETLVFAAREKLLSMFVGNDHMKDPEVAKDAMLVLDSASHGDRELLIVEFSTDRYFRRAIYGEPDDVQP